jgi:hypothetical protein
MWATHNGSSVLFALTMASLSIKPAGDVQSSVEQRIIKFFCDEGEKSADIHRRLQLQFGEE